MNDINTDNIRLLIFDLDGTLADTIWSIREGVNLAMKKHGFPEKSYDETRMNVGNGARELIRRSMPKGAAEDLALFDEVYDDYESFYAETCGHCRECYEGMMDALLTLKSSGYTLAVLSNKQDKFVKIMTESLLPKGLAALSIGQTDMPKKPDPTVPLLMASSLGFEPHEVAFIGDSDVDIKTAQNAHMLSVGCSWGYRSREVLAKAGADIIIDHPSELCNIFA